MRRAGQGARLAGRAIAAAGERPLKKAVDALAIVPTKDKILPLARKLYNVLLYFAQRQGQDEQIYRAPLRDLVRVVDFNSNNTEVIKNHLRQLVTTKVEWQSPTTGEGARWSVSALIAHCDLILKGGELIIEWSYAPNIKLQLLDPQRYARISLVYQAALRSMASLVLYEVCTRYVDNPGGVTARQPWQWWRPVLTGTPEAEVDTYQEYKYFKRDVLKSAVAEINAVTDLEIALIEHKQGRAVAEIQFSVRRKEQPSLPMQHLMPLDLEAVGEAIRQGVPQDAAEQLIARHGEKAMTAALKTMAARRAYRSMPDIESPGKFLAGHPAQPGGVGQAGARQSGSRSSAWQGHFAGGADRAVSQPEAGGARDLVQGTGRGRAGELAAEVPCGGIAGGFTPLFSGLSRRPGCRIRWRGRSSIGGSRSRLGGRGGIRRVRRNYWN